MLQKYRAALFLEWIYSKIPPCIFWKGLFPSLERLTGLPVLGEGREKVKTHKNKPNTRQTKMIFLFIKNNDIKCWKFLPGYHKPESREKSGEFSARWATPGGAEPPWASLLHALASLQQEQQWWAMAKKPASAAGITRAGWKQPNRRALLERGLKMR